MGIDLKALFAVEQQGEEMKRVHATGEQVQRSQLCDPAVRHRAATCQPCLQIATHPAGPGVMQLLRNSGNFEAAAGQSVSRHDVCGVKGPDVRKAVAWTCLLNSLGRHIKAGHT